MITLSEINQDSFAAGHVLAADGSGTVRWAQFLSEIAVMREKIRNIDSAHFALYEEDAYRFAVALFGLLAEDKRVFLPGENHNHVAGELGNRGAVLVGDFPGNDPIVTPSGQLDSAGGKEPFRLRGELIVFTSGSTGDAKAIPKTQSQLDAELLTLEALWGKSIDGATVLATVSHQHLYGLLFVVLWPICAGRIFWRSRFDSPMGLMKQARKCVDSAWIMSPAHLHRMGEELPWEEARRSARQVFSSGGLLKTAASRQIAERLGTGPLEVLGSSETGGIAWRTQAGADEPWTAFPCIDIGQATNGALVISSPFLPDRDPHTCDDAVKMESSGKFHLLGRLDRIVKMEGKRVSLPAVETALQHHPWVEAAHALPLSRKRESVAAVLALNERGRVEYRELGHRRFSRVLQDYCRERLPVAAVPRNWRLLDRLPLNEQGKLRSAALRELFDKDRYPTVLSIEETGNDSRLILFVDASCPYFSGHFPGAPVLPGVTQLLWAERFARKTLGIDGKFLDMRVVKFRELIRPNTEMTLSLGYTPDSGRLEFIYESSSGVHSQGRMMFEVSV